MLRSVHFGEVFISIIITQVDSLDFMIVNFIKVFLLI